MNAKKAVERQTGVAIWRQIADRIRSSISNGDYDQTGMVPPEIVLAGQFGVNRHTVRSALAALADEGLVQAIQGRGTMVQRKERLSFPISRRTRFSQGLGGQARETVAKLLSQAVLPVAGDVAAGLRIAPGTDCIQLSLVSSADGRPVSCSTNFFPIGRFPHMAAHVEKLGSITKAFAAEGLPDYVRISTELVARHADAEELALLRLSPGAIVIEATAVNGDPDGVPVQFARTRFAADRVKLKIET
jgi:GntR family phosphonate transport system transcriptional regulator